MHYLILFFAIFLFVSCEFQKTEKLYCTFDKKDLSREKLLGMMAGGEELNKLEVELKEIDRVSKN